MVWFYFFTNGIRQIIAVPFVCFFIKNWHIRPNSCTAIIHWIVIFSNRISSACLVDCRFSFPMDCIFTCPMSYFGFYTIVVIINAFFSCSFGWKHMIRLADFNHTSSFETTLNTFCSRHSFIYNGFIFSADNFEKWFFI